MTDERKLYVSTGRSIFDNTVYSNSFTWLDFINTIKRFRVINHSVGDYKKLDRQVKHKLKDTGYFIFGKFSKNLRRKEFLINREGLTLDFDDVTYKDMENSIKALESINFNYCLYTTASYDGSNGKFRIIIPFNKPIAPKDYKRVAERIIKDSPLPKNIDEASFNVSQAFNFPTRLKDIEPVFKYRTDGIYFNVDSYLIDEPTQQDITSIKTSTKMKYDDLRAIDLVKKYVANKNNDLADYTNFLPCLMSIVKGVYDKEISEEVAPKLLKILANGNTEWEKENIKKFNRELKNGYPQTQYSFSKRFDGQKLSIIEERKLMTAPKLEDATLKPVTFYIDNLIPQGVGWLAGSPKVGKSYLAMQIAHCISSGDEFLSYKIKNIAPTIYYSLEMADNLVQQRLKQMFYDTTLSNEFFIIYELPNFNHGLMEALKYDLSRTKAKVLIIDVHGLISMNKSSQKPLYEQSYEEIRTFKKLADEHNLTIILVTHLNKGGQGIDMFDRMMGSAGNRGSSDFNIILARDDIEKGKFIFNLESRKAENVELVLERDSSGKFFAVGTVSDLEKQRDYTNFMTNNIVKSIIDLMGSNKKIEVTATEILEHIPEGARFDEKMEDLTALKIGHRIKKLIPKFKKYKGWEIIKRKEEKTTIYIITISDN